MSRGKRTPRGGGENAGREGEGEGEQAGIPWTFTVSLPLFFICFCFSPRPLPLFPSERRRREKLFTLPSLHSITSHHAHHPIVISLPLAGCS